MCSSQEECCILICQKFHLLRVSWYLQGNKVTFSRTGNSIKGFDFASVMVLASREESFADFCVCTCCYWCSWWVAESS